MAKGLSATQRTLNALRHQGRVCFMVERFNPHAGPFGIRQDGLGFIDLISCDPERGIVAIQSTTTAFKQHIDKILIDCADYAMEWLRCGGKIEVYGWRKIKLQRGGKALRWQPRIREITLQDFGTEQNPSPNAL